MKKKSPPYAIILAVVVGLLGIFLLLRWKSGMDAASDAKIAAATKAMQDQINDLKNQKQPVVLQTATNMRQVYYATQPVNAGDRLSPAFFEKKLTPNDIIPDAYDDDKDIIGSFAIRKIEKGDPLTPHNVAKTLPYLSQRISPGMRALSLPVFNSEYNATGGFVVDGDKVDLLYTTTSLEGFVLKTELVMQNVDVLFVPGPQYRSDQTDGIIPAPAPGQPISVTFQVTPEQAQALILMGQVKNGKFSMILRGRPDKSEIKIKPFVASDYASGFSKVQRTVDRSQGRVDELRQQIEEQQKIQAAQGNKNETPKPTPPSP